VLKDARFAKDRRRVSHPPRMPFERVPEPLTRSLQFNMLDLDAPDHTRLRALVHKAFTPRLIERLRERIQSLADHLLDGPAQRGELDPARTPNPHLAFGQGVHYCLGAPLARLEGQIAFETLLRRFSDMQVAVPVASLPWRRGVFLRGVERLPLRVRAAPRGGRVRSTNAAVLANGVAPGGAAGRRSRQEIVAIGAGS